MLALNTNQSINESINQCKTVVVCLWLDGYLHTAHVKNLYISEADLEGACGAYGPPKIRKAYVIGTGYEYDGNVFVAWVLQIRRAEVVTK